MYNFNIELLLNDLFRTGFNQGMVSDRTGISQSTVSRILGGTREPSMDEFLKLCHMVRKTPFEYFERAEK